MTVADRKKIIKAETKLGEELQKYSGEWVAISSSAVVGHATTLDSLLSQVEPNSVDRYMQVSPHKTSLSFF